MRLNPVLSELRTYPFVRLREAREAVEAHGVRIVDFGVGEPREETPAFIREAMLRTFANHDSKSVQQTLYAMAESALEEIHEIDEIQITMPNKHCLLVDLARFGQDNPNEIFVPTDEPHGYIEARVRRRT